MKSPYRDVSFSTAEKKDFSQVWDSGQLNYAWVSEVLTDYKWFSRKETSGLRNIAKINLSLLATIFNTDFFQ